MAIAEFFDPNTGRLMASPDLLSFVCRRSGTQATQSRLGGNTSPSSLVIAVSGFTLPVVAVRSEGYAAAFSGTDVNGNLVFQTDAPIGTTFTYWAFDWSLSLPEHFNVFELRREQDNAIAFSSAFYPMILIGKFDMSEGNTGQQYNALAGVTLAHTTSNMGGHSRVSNPQCWDTGGPVVDPDLTSCSDIRGRIDGKLYGARTSGSQLTGAEVSWDDVNATFGRYSEYQRYGGGFDVPATVQIIDVSYIPVGRTFF
jgi:hypothetical protein